MLDGCMGEGGKQTILPMVSSISFDGERQTHKLKKESTLPTTDDYPVNLSFLLHLNERFGRVITPLISLLLSVLPFSVSSFSHLHLLPSFSSLSPIVAGGEWVRIQENEGRQYTSFLSFIDSDEFKYHE